MAELTVAAGLAIVAGYLYLLFCVPAALLLFSPPNTPRRITLALKLGGGMFFLTCGITHMSQVIHVWQGDTVGLDLLAPTHVANMVVQAVAVWAFGVALPKFLALIRESLVPPVRRKRADD